MDGMEAAAPPGGDEVVRKWGCSRTSFFKELAADRIRNAQALVMVRRRGERLVVADPWMTLRRE